MTSSYRENGFDGNSENPNNVVDIRQYPELIFDNASNCLVESEKDLIVNFIDLQNKFMKEIDDERISNFCRLKLKKPKELSDFCYEEIPVRILDGNEFM